MVLKHAVTMRDNYNLFVHVCYLHETLHGSSHTTASVYDVLRKCSTLEATATPIAAIRGNIEYTDLIALPSATLMNCWAWGQPLLR